MDIKKAKEQIKNAMTAYFTKDENGEYMIPIEKQRPVFLMGAPGIGKTAIVEQVATEMGVGLLSYSMTHHTRQSALGLPFIQHKNYKGLECDISEYTMSEIIASVYDLMEETGIEEGILFLDEINCVSETLAPIMLQFLQYKVFGRHRVPNGWIVVTAGNPPEYNNSVREFDIVTWDRLKRIDVEPDFDVWKEYAYLSGVHPAILTYLEIKKSDFYSVETTVDGKSFVTARGWDDLSQMIRFYEMHDLPVDEELIRQYLQNTKIAKNFAAYYDLFKKYQSDYQVDTVLSGTPSENIKERAKSAKFDERLSLLGLMLDAITLEVKKVLKSKKVISELQVIFKQLKKDLTAAKKTPYELLAEVSCNKDKEIEAGKKSGSMSREDIAAKLDIIAIIDKEKASLSNEQDGEKAFAAVKKDFNRLVKDLKDLSEKTGVRLNNVFKFCEEAFDEDKEILIFVTELTANYHTAKFISEFGCEEYFKHNKVLLFYERQNEIIQSLSDLKL